MAKDYMSGAGLQLMSSDPNSYLFPESTAANHVSTELGYKPEAINIAYVAANYFTKKSPSEQAGQPTLSAFSSEFPRLIDPPENFIVTLTGTAREDQVLFVQVDGSLSDPDIVGVIRYQWQRSDGQGGWIDIAGATSTSYVSGDVDVSYQIRVQYTTSMAAVRQKWYLVVLPR